MNNIDITSTNNIVKFNLDKEKLNITKTVTLVDAAFAGIFPTNSIFTFSPQKGKFATVSFECLDEECTVIDLGFTLDYTNNEELFEDLYYDYQPTGLLSHMYNKVGRLRILEIFTKVTEEGEDYYATTVVDMASVINNIARGEGLKASELVYYRLLVPTNKFIYIMAVLQDIIASNPMGYNYNDEYDKLPREFYNIDIREDLYDINLEALDYPSLSLLDKFHTNDHNVANALIHFSNKQNPEESFYTIWVLDFLNSDWINILKNKKYPKVMDKICGLKDVAVYNSVLFTLIEYKIKADNPIEKIVILSNNIGEPKQISNDIDDITMTISIRSWEYTNLINKISDQIMKK